MIQGLTILEDRISDSDKRLGLIHKREKRGLRMRRGSKLEPDGGEKCVTTVSMKTDDD